ncbi:MAG: small, acid-soluble spore protein, alpha/beta type [Chitinophagales bacterium]
MAQGQKRNQALLRGAAKGLDNFKYEIATELGINQDYKSGYWGNISSRECGAVGGHMVRRMIAAAEQSLISQAAANVSQAFKSNLNASLGSAAGWESDLNKTQATTTQY